MTWGKEWTANNYDRENHNCADFVRAICRIPKEKGKALSEQIANFREKPVQYMQPGDIILNANFSHCGVCTQYPYVIHYTQNGVVVEPYIYAFAGGFAYVTMD